jgi:hypothetical protein
MGQNLFGAIAEGISDTFRHLGNADPMMLVLIAGGVALVGYFLLKR